MSDREDIFEEIYCKLLEAYGPQGWWPVTPPGGGEPRYTGGPGTEPQRFEVVVGALLTQNTAWRNASLAICNLNEAGLMAPAGIAFADRSRLARLIRAAGYFNQKAKRLRALARFFLEGNEVTREALLRLEGVGPETADSILLYGFGKAFFVVDAYTRRIFGRLGLVPKREPYELIRERFERALPRNVDIYNEYHALIVEHAKRFCRKRPHCSGCPLTFYCPSSENIDWK